MASCADALLLPGVTTAYARINGRNNRDSKFKISAPISHLRVPKDSRKLVHSIVAAAIAAALLCSGTGPSFATYHCEDVTGYYASLEGLHGEALMERLSAVISPHRVLSYKKVPRSNEQFYPRSCIVAEGPRL